MFLTFSFEGASPKVPPNQSTRKIINLECKTLNNRTNENVTHVENRRHKTWKLTKRQFKFWMNVF
jgi:hypothetical protein